MNTSLKLSRNETPSIESRPCVLQVETKVPCVRRSVDRLLKRKTVRVESCVRTYFVQGSATPRISISARTEPQGIVRHVTSRLPRTRYLSSGRLVTPSPQHRCVLYMYELRPCCRSPCFSLCGGRKGPTSRQPERRLFRVLFGDTHSSRIYDPWVRSTLGVAWGVGV